MCICSLCQADQVKLGCQSHLTTWGVDHVQTTQLTTRRYLVPGQAPRASVPVSVFSWKVTLLHTPAQPLRIYAARPICRCGYVLLVVRLATESLGCRHLQPAQYCSLQQQLELTTAVSEQLGPCLSGVGAPCRRYGFMGTSKHVVLKSLLQ
jgi:hypothetical protein